METAGEAGVRGKSERTGGPGEEGEKKGRVKSGLEKERHTMQLAHGGSHVHTVTFKGRVDPHARAIDRLFFFHAPLSIHGHRRDIARTQGSTRAPL